MIHPIKYYQDLSNLREELTEFADEYGDTLPPNVSKSFQQIQEYLESNISTTAIEVRNHMKNFK